MRVLKSLGLLFGFASIFISSCNSNVPTVTPEIPVVIVTSTSERTNTTSPTKTPFIEPTHTPEPSDKPGFIVTLSGGGHADLGIPIFSTNGKVVALAGAIIRLWDVNSHEMILELKNPYGGVCFVRNAKFNPDSNLFAVSLQSCDGIDNISAGRLLVWDLNTGNLLQEWKQETAKMPPTTSDGGDYTIPVSAMAFLPNNNSIVFASGNTLEIRDVFQNEKHDTLELGQEMYASQISTSHDGKTVYVLMHWMKTNDLPELWTEQYKLQVWNTNIHSMLREIKYPDGWANLSLTLLGTSLIETDFKKENNQIIHLEEDKVKSIPFCSGREFYSADGSFMVCARAIDDKKTVELWNTDSRQIIYTFAPDFEKDWLYSVTGIAFSPDNTMLAIAHDDQISLWNIRPVVQP